MDSLLRLATRRNGRERRAESGSAPIATLSFQFHSQSVLLQRARELKIDGFWNILQQLQESSGKSR